MALLSLSTTNIPHGLDERKSFLIKYFKENIQGKSTINIDTGLSINFGRNSRMKTAERHNSKETTVVIMNIIIVLQNATYNNFGDPKPKHLLKYPSLKKFVNFKCKIRIDGKVKDYRISCMILQGNKVQYDLHESSLEYATCSGKK